MFKKLFVLTIVVVAIFILGGLLYWCRNDIKDNDEIVVDAAATLRQPIIRWQKITIVELQPKMALHIHAPRIIIGSNYSLYSEINTAITRHVESLKADFISAATTAAEDNGETNLLNVATEVLLATPELISLAFTSTKRFAGINNSDPERTFTVFDLVNNKAMIEGNELFRDDIAWSRAVTMMKNYLLADEQGNPSCDLLFAPQHHGFAASCIGVDGSRGGKYFSITGDIPMSMIQEFIAPSVLSAMMQ